MKVGETNASAKLTKQNVIEIRMKAANGSVRKLLAEEYNVSKSLIDKILTYKVWQNTK